MVTYFNAHTHKIPDDGSTAIVNVECSGREDAVLPPLCSAGIHPAEADETQLPLLEKLLRTGRFQFLGECGLDHLSPIPAEIQRAVFRRQIRLSEELSLPMIIHSVRSNPEIIAERKKAKAHMPWIIHSFRGNELEAKAFLEHDCIPSLAPEAVLHAQKIPSYPFLLETDMTDHPIGLLYKAAAEKSGRSAEELVRQIRELLSGKFLLNL